MIFSGCQAIYAVMVTTPEQRLSEPVLAEAVALYYTEQRMIPAGIHMEAVSQLAGKMAMGIKKMVIKFRRTWKESPDQSKLKGLTELKARLKKTLSEENLTSPRSATAEEVETVTKAVPPVRPEVAVAVQSAGVDWQAAAAKLRAFKEKQSKQQTEKRPVATPARSAKHLLPAHVVDTLKLPSEAVQPFAITGKHKDDIAEENEEDEGKAPKKKKKNLTCKAGIRWKEKKTEKKNAITAEDEAALAVPKISPEKAAGASDDGTLQYQPGTFNQARTAWIRKYRAETGKTFKEASAKWLICDERMSYLATVPPSELKKRRFS